jgi:hypothetical protein
MKSQRIRIESLNGFTVVWEQVLVAMSTGVIGSLAALTLLDPQLVGWRILRAVGEAGAYTDHGWLTARDFRFWNSLLIGIAIGAVVALVRRRGLREAFWFGGIAGFVIRIVVPLGDFVVE